VVIQQSIESYAMLSHLRIEVVEITKEEAHGGRSGCNLPHKSFLSPFLHVIPKEKAVHISKSKNVRNFLGKSIKKISSIKGS